MSISVATVAKEWGAQIDLRVWLCAIERVDIIFPCRMAEAKEAEWHFSSNQFAR